MPAVVVRFDRHTIALYLLSHTPCQGVLVIMNGGVSQSWLAMVVAKSWHTETLMES